MNSISKNAERRCFDIVQHIKHYDILQGDVIECERPDFIIGSVGLEHFLVDVITDNCSINRKQSNLIQNKVMYYKEHPDVLDEDVMSDKALSYVQDVINKQICGISTFDYQTFADNFKRVYYKHYKNIHIYRRKCDRLGFLIEIPYIKPIGTESYVIIDNNKKREQRIKTIPITKNMIECFKCADNVDFIIICAIPFNFGNNYSNCQVIMVGMDDVEQSIRKQNMIICDKFDFPLKFKNKNVVRLITEHNAQTE